MLITPHNLMTVNPSTLFAKSVVSFAALFMVASGASASMAADYAPTQKASYPTYTAPVTVSAKAPMVSRANR